MMGDNGSPTQIRVVHYWSTRPWRRLLSVASTSDSGEEFGVTHSTVFSGRLCGRMVGSDQTGVRVGETLASMIAAGLKRT